MRASEPLPSRVQDSTVVKLPARRFGAFSGVSNAHGPTCHGRIQAFYDLRNR